MQQKPFLFLVVLILATLIQSPAEVRDRPNILFMMSDDHALEGIGAYESWLKDYCHTPAIDQLAFEGMRFNNVCCNKHLDIIYGLV